MFVLLFVIKLLLSYLVIVEIVLLVVNFILVENFRILLLKVIMLNIFLGFSLVKDFNKVFFIFLSGFYFMFLFMLIINIIFCLKIYI